MQHPALAACSKTSGCGGIHRGDELISSSLKQRAELAFKKRNADIESVVVDFSFVEVGK